MSLASFLHVIRIHIIGDKTSYFPWLFQNSLPPMVSSGPNIFPYHFFIQHLLIHDVFCILIKKLSSTI